MSLNKLEMAKELADTLLNIFKRGLYDSKHFKADGTFVLPIKFYKDVYISGFVQHFISVSLFNTYDKLRTWKKDEIGKFVLDVYKEIKLSESDTEFYKKLITDKNTEKNWDTKGNYTLGKTHARLCYISKIPLALEKEKHPLISQVKKELLDEDIVDNEDYDSKMTAKIYEMTIYSYLKNQFGLLNDEKTEFSEDKNEKKSNVKAYENINDLPIKYYEEYNKRIEQFRLQNSPKHGAPLYGILFGVGSMMLISFTLTLNRVDGELQAVIGGLLIGGIAYFAQHQNEKNYSIKLVSEMNKIEKELINKATSENLTLEEKINLISERAQKLRDLKQEKKK